MLIGRAGDIPTTVAAAHGRVAVHVVGAYAGWSIRFGRSGAGFGRLGARVGRSRTRLVGSHAFAVAPALGDPRQALVDARSEVDDPMPDLADVSSEFENSMPILSDPRRVLVDLSPDLGDPGPADLSEANHGRCKA